MRRNHFKPVFTWLFCENKPVLLLEIIAFDQFLCIGEGSQKFGPSEMLLD
jgi:hypothetical protein